MGIAAHNIGASEARLGPEYLRRVAQRLGLPLVSANVTDNRGRPIAEPLRVVEAAGLRVAFVGLLDERFADEKIRVTPPREAALNALKRADEPYDVVVVLRHGLDFLHRMSRHREQPALRLRDLLDANSPRRTVAKRHADEADLRKSK